MAWVSIIRLVVIQPCQQHGKLESWHRTPWHKRSGSGSVHNSVVEQVHHAVIVPVMVALVVCITLVAAVLVAMLVGCLLPIGAKRLGFDPAVMASPFITTIVDALSLLIYCTVASMLLGL